jgi:hypothetical protein
MGETLTDQQWLELMFEFEFCEECGGDVADHVVGPDPLGNRHAYCLLDPIDA